MPERRVLVLADRHPEARAAITTALEDDFDIRFAPSGAGLQDYVWSQDPVAVVVDTRWFGDLDSEAFKAKLAAALEPGGATVAVYGRFRRVPNLDLSASQTVSMVDRYLGDGKDPVAIARHLLLLLAPPAAGRISAVLAAPPPPRAPAVPAQVDPEPVDEPSASSLEWMNFVSSDPRSKSKVARPEPDDAAGQTFPDGYEPTWSELMAAGVSGKNVGRIVRKASKGSIRKG